MKFLIIILLFIGLKGYGQTISVQASSIAFINNATLTISSGTYTAGNTYVFFITTSSASTPTDNPTISSGSLTLTKRHTVTGATQRIIAYTCTPASTTTTAITFTYAETQGLHIYVIYEGNNIGRYKLINSAGVNETTGANPSLTLPSTNNSVTCAYFINGRNPFAGTEEAGWTEDIDTGTASTFGNAAYHRNVTTDNTVSVTATSSTYMGIAVQFSFRRIFNR